MSRAATAAGILCAAGLCAALPLTLGSLPRAIDLEINMLSPRPHQVLESASAPDLPAKVSPRRLSHRIKSLDFPNERAAGLNLRTRRIVYGRRWEKEVTVPSLVGPFIFEGSYACGLAARLHAGLFDTKAAGAGLKAALHRKLREGFPKTVQAEGISIVFPELRETELAIKLGQGGVDVAISLVLADGTRLNAGFPARLWARDGTPVLERAGDVSPGWTGPTRAQAVRAGAQKGAEYGGGWGTLAGLVLGGAAGASIGGGIGADLGSQMGAAEANSFAEQRAKIEITAQVDAALADLSMGLGALREPLLPDPRRPRDSIRLKLGGNPVVSPSSITLPLCVAVAVGEPKMDAAVPGPALVLPQGPLAFEAPANGAGASVELVADASVINQALYFAWQSGLFRELGRSSLVLDALPEKIRSLAFDVTGFDPGLPPTAMAGAMSPLSSGLPIVFGDVALGVWDHRRVSGHGAAILELHQNGDTLDFLATLKRVTVSCSEARSGGITRFSPCLSDLLPAAREVIEGAPLQKQLPGGALVAMLPRGPFKGLGVEWSDLHASLRGGPPRLQIQVNARTKAGP